MSSGESVGISCGNQLSGVQLAAEVTLSIHSHPPHTHTFMAYTRTTVPSLYNDEYDDNYDDSLSA